MWGARVIGTASLYIVAFPIIAQNRGEVKPRAGERGRKKGKDESFLHICKKNVDKVWRVGYDEGKKKESKKGGRVYEK